MHTVSSYVVSYLLKSSRCAVKILSFLFTMATCQLPLAFGVCCPSGNGVCCRQPDTLSLLARLRIVPRHDMRLQAVSTYSLLRCSCRYGVSNPERLWHAAGRSLHMSSTPAPRITANAGAEPCAKSPKRFTR
ncbi:hypothetical protein M432DRAFT_313511 [Thermoascus aurantiacus ATCC 26904]